MPRRLRSPIGVLVLFLILAALAKLVFVARVWAGEARCVGSPWIYLATALLELLAAALVARRSTRPAGVLLCFGGFLGAGTTTIALWISHGMVAPCNCLGEIRVHRSVALGTQGAIVALCGWILLVEGAFGRNRDRTQARRP